MNRKTKSTDKEIPARDRGRRYEICPNGYAHNYTSECALSIVWIDPPNPVRIELGCPNIWTMLYGDPNDNPAEVERLLAK